MEKFSSWIGLFLLLTAPSVQAGYSPGGNGRTLTHDAVLRDFDVHAPSGYTGLRSIPLVVDLHGAGSNKVEHRAISGWSTRADASGFLVAYPNGLFNTWNAGVCCGGAVLGLVDDVGFIRAMVASISSEAPVDPLRIYVTGLSNGGAMSHRLACEAADLFAAAAPMAFPIPYTDFASQCQPSRPIPVLAFMGLTDIVIPYTGGFFGDALPSLEAWRAQNSCGSEPMEIHETYGGSYCDIDTSCTAEVEVGLCSIRGSDLAPPLDIFNGHLLYINDDAMVLADRAWTFFLRFAPPPAGIPLAGPIGWGVLGLLLMVAGFAMLSDRRR